MLDFYMFLSMISLRQQRNGDTYREGQGRTEEPSLLSGKDGAFSIYNNSDYATHVKIA